MSQTCYALDCCGEEHYMQVVAERIHLCNHEGTSEEDILTDKAMEALGSEVAPCFLFRKLLKERPDVFSNDPYLVKFWEKYQSWVTRGQIKPIGNLRRIC